ncbi:MAG: DUF6596 domain-containing protein [Gemmatimonadaceae bacterium]
MTSPPDHDVERLLRELAPLALGAVVRRYRDFAASEDAVQEALIAAAAQWPLHGVPGNPLGWLIQVAGRRMTDVARSEIARRGREALVVTEAPDSASMPEVHDVDPDDTLVLLFMCCHPALTPSSALALTLRAVGGLTTAEIAKAFLVPEATIGQRITRAKASIRASAIPFAIPDAGERAARLSSVLHVLYLIFNEGYASTSGDVVHRADLALEAIRLMRDVHKLLPQDGDVIALLALMLLTDARRTARTGPRGELIPLDEQDRTLWNRASIDEGIALASEALARGSLGEYHLLAAIAAVHDEAPNAAATDWPQVLQLYEMLMRAAPSPMAALNHAVATAMVEGPAAGLALLEPLRSDERLQSTHRLDAVRAHLLERAGEHEAAAALFRTAAARATSVPERDFLLGRAERYAR